ncbi:MAG: YqeG family HAD IIIA-type phosphatase [Armatimonadetes bacterium]|nr:YqeG family HAD IIIA-type phosphatase [Armatimonadota bacterium]MDE2205280.1 YqeG family HAD IIIA-type phosphatase [Armatimonadota bacterium]
MPSSTQRREQHVADTNGPRLGRTPRPRVHFANLCPDELVETVAAITPEHLKRQGIRGVILDMDNTLVRWQRQELAPEALAWLEALKALSIGVCILSNSFFGHRSDRLASRIGCVNIRKAKKPMRGGFNRAMKALGTEPGSTAIVGDQMFTDVLGGNRVGCRTIMVRRIHCREFLYTRIFHRPLEWLFLGYFRRAGAL